MAQYRLLLSRFLEIVRILIAAAIGACGSSYADDFNIPNAGFESYSTEMAPSVWQVNPNGYLVAVDTEVAFSGKASLRIASSTSRSPDHGASVVQFSQPMLPTRHTLRLSGKLKVDSLEDGHAGLWAMVRRGDETTYINTLQDDGLAGTMDWRDVSIKIEVVENADMLIVGVLNAGDGTAWYDGIRLELLDSDQPSQGESVPDRSATAAECERIGSTSDSYSNANTRKALESRVRLFLRSLMLDEVKILAVGEFTHGANEVDFLNSTFAKQVYATFGGGVLALESSFVSCPLLGPENTNLTAKDLMRRCAGPQKQTNEYLGLMEFIVSTWSSEAPLFLTGIDTAILDNYAEDAYADLKGVLRNADPILAKALEAQGVFDQRTVHGEIENSLLPRDTHEKVLELLEEAIFEFESSCSSGRSSACPLDKRQRQIAHLQLHNLLSHSIQVASGLTTAQAKIERDEAMARNLEYMSDYVFPSQVIILLAHNAHLRQKNEDVIELGVNRLQVGMGSLLHRRYSDAYVVIGTAANEGRTREPVVGLMDMNEVTPESTVFDVDENGLGFFSEGIHNEKVSFFYQNVSHVESGNSLVEYTPANQYDGLFVFGNVTPSILCR